MGWHCLTLTSFNFCMSTVRLGSPLCFLQTTMRWHQVRGVFSGTSSNTPRATSRSRSFLTLTFQWTGTAAGVNAW